MTKQRTTNSSLQMMAKILHCGNQNEWKKWEQDMKVRTQLWSGEKGIPGMMAASDGQVQKTTATWSYQKNAGDEEPDALMNTQLPMEDGIMQSSCFMDDVEEVTDVFELEHSPEKHTKGIGDRWSLLHYCDVQANTQTIARHTGAPKTVMPTEDGIDGHFFPECNAEETAKVK